MLRLDVKLYPGQRQRLGFGRGLYKGLDGVFLAFGRIGVECLIDGKILVVWIVLRCAHRLGVTVIEGRVQFDLRRQPLADIGLTRDVVFVVLRQ